VHSQLIYIPAEHEVTHVWQDVKALDPEKDQLHSPHETQSAIVVFPLNGLYVFFGQEVHVVNAVEFP
jgi:hypothetical protein